MLCNIINKIKKFFIELELLGSSLMMLKDEIKQDSYLLL